MVTHGGHASLRSNNGVSSLGCMPFKFRFSRWRVAVLVVAAFLLACVVFLKRSNEPVYQGRPLGKWMRGDRKEYYPAVLALGTNALPYLLAELQASDSRASQWGEDVLAKLIDSGPLWRTARDRRNRASLALQILDTNAVPALLEMIFSKPMRMMEGDPSWSAASVLTFLATEAAQNQVSDRIADALCSTDADQRRNACLTLAIWPHPRADFHVLLPTLCGDSNAMVRAAAMRAMTFTVWTNEQTMSALVSGLADEQATIRWLAISSLANRGSNAISALPALHAAYSNELAQSNLRGDLGGVTWGAHSWTAQDMRSVIRGAIKSIEPKASLPVDPP